MIFGFGVRKGVDPIAAFRARIYDTFGGSVERALVAVLSRPLSRSDAAAILSWNRAEDVLRELRSEWMLALDVRVMQPMMDAFRASMTHEYEEMGLLAKRLDQGGVRLMGKSMADGVVWYEQEHQRLARTLSVDQERAIMHMVARARASGYSVARLRTMIQNSGVVGLDERGVNAVFNMMRRELDSLSSQAVFENAAAYTQRLIRARAAMISRTTMSRAIHAGKISAWRDAARYGRLRDDPYMEWVADGNPCNVCAGIDGTIVPLGAGFGGGLGMPPDPHPNCMCTLRLVDQFGFGMRPGKPKLARRRFNVGRPKTFPQTFQTFF